MLTLSTNAQNQTPAHNYLTNKNSMTSLQWHLEPPSWFSENQGHWTPWQFKACFVRVTVNFWLFMDRLSRLQVSGLLLSWKKFFGYHTETSKNLQLFLHEKELLSKSNSPNPPPHTPFFSLVTHFCTEIRSVLYLFTFIPAILKQ